MKNKLKIYLGILLFGISFLLWNCEQENSIDSTSENQSIISVDEVKKQFNASFNKNAYPNLKSPKWENARVFYNEIGNQYLEIPFQTLNAHDIEKGTSVSFDKLVAFSNKNSISLNVIHFFAIKSKDNFVNYEDISHTELDSFSGFLTAYDMNKNVLDIKHYKQGVDTNSKIKIKDKNDNFLKNAEDEEGGTSEFTETICTRGCWYWEYADGRRVTISCSPWSCTTTTYQVPGNNNDSNNTSYNTEEDVDKIEDKDLIDPKIRCLNTNLNLYGSSFIKDILKNFEGESEVDIHIKSVNKVYNAEGEEVNAITSPIRNDIITIEISSFEASSNKALEVVRTLIHEYIHADMFRKLREIDDDLHKYPDFKETYDKYDNEKFEATAQHNTMAELYVHQMRDALKSYHKNVLVGDYNYLTDNGTNPIDDNFYEALAWQGLKEHDVKAYSDLSDTKKQALESSLNQHYHSTTANCPNN